MKNLHKNWLAYALLIGMAVVWLFIFTLILIHGKFGIYEPNLAILILEIAACAGAVALGIERVHNLIRSHNGKRKAKI